MSEKTTEVIEEQDQEFEEWQFEFSSNLATHFIENDLLPKLQTFDFDNSEKDYVPGLAHYAMFLELIPILGQMGYSIEDLAEDLQEYIDGGGGYTIH